MRTVTDCQMLEMERNVLEVLKKQSRTFREQLEQDYRRRALDTHLRSVREFASLPDDFINELRERVELVSFEPGDVISRQGEPADSFYLIRLGFVRVSQQHPGGEIVLQNRDYSQRPYWRFFDKDTYPLKEIDGLTDTVRVVPGGSSVRRGVYLGPRVVIMPPSYINVGAYVGEGTMVDSHVLVGSCAQIGRRVHLSAGTQIGGVLEPAGALPVIVEDDVFISGQCGLFEGVLIKRRAVLSAGVILTGSTPVYDLVRETIYRRSETDPLIIPEGAVVIPGARPAEGYFARSHQLMMAAPLIVKYRDDQTDARTTLEMTLR